MPSVEGYCEIAPDRSEIAKIHGHCPQRHRDPEAVLRVTDPEARTAEIGDLLAGWRSPAPFTGIFR